MLLLKMDKGGGAHHGLLCFNNHRKIAALIALPKVALIKRILVDHGSYQLAQDEHRSQSK